MSRLIKYLGILIIISFSSLSVYKSLTLRSLAPWDPQIKWFKYTSYFEDRFFDLRMNQTIDPKNKDTRLVMADIDDYSIKALGQWPIYRGHWATLIKKLKGYGAKIVAFDVFFSEKARACGKDDPDQAIADAISDFQKKPGNHVIIPYNLKVGGTKDFPEIPEDLYSFALNAKTGGEDFELYPTKISDSVYPISTIVDAEPSLGFIEASADVDGVIRHYKLVANAYKEVYVPSYSLSVYQHYIGEMSEGYKKKEGEVSTHLDLSVLGQPALVTNKGRIYLNDSGETKMHWLGDETHFPRVSIYDVISKSEDDKKLKKLLDGAIVFVGATAFGAHDIRHTPVNPMLPGVYFHMNMVHSLLEGKLLKPFSDSVKYSWFILLGSVLLLLLVQIKDNPILDIVTLNSIIGILYYVDTYHLIPAGYEIRLFFCFFALIGCYSWNTFLHFYLANKDKAFLKNAFGNYISPELIDEMHSTGEPPKLGGDSGIRTAFFTDIQGFSSFSEKLSATELVELLNEYLTAMTDILLEEKGTLDKYEGDAIIAFFGAPMPLEDHAARACMVAHKMQERLLLLREKWVSEGDKWPQIVHDMRMRIGMNSGEIVTGNMGSKSRMNYTMMGDSVNLAARLEESAKQYGIFTQVAKETVELAGPDFLWRELDTIKVVGKEIPVTSYDLLGLKDTAPEHLQKLSILFKEALKLYKEQKWDDALTIFKETLELEYERFPALKGVKTNPSEIYIKRCEDYKKNPPGHDWDGVYTLTSK